MYNCHSFKPGLVLAPSMNEALTRAGHQSGDTASYKDKGR